MDQTAFLNLLAGAVQHGVSDVHLQAGLPPGFRLKGDLVSVKMPALTDADLQLICKIMMQQSSGKQATPDLKDFDGSFEIKNLCRFRFNIFKHRGHHGAILRLIPSKVPTIESLGLPPVLRSIAEMHRGLVLVTGATGSGKSSTLAAMIDHINATQPFHILTIEDPVEFVHTPKRARITQREIGPDCGSFAGALRAALRQDPDVILVGEMRDPETIDVALKAAETGHMVLSTVHTTDAIKTIGRLIAVFPPEEQRVARMRLADNLTATVSQRLVKRADGKGMVAAQEIMVASSAIRECIADPALTGTMNDYITKSKDGVGGQTFEQHLVQFFREGVITMDEAKDASTNPADLERNLLYGTSSSGGGSAGAGDTGDALQLETGDSPDATPPAPDSEVTHGDAMQVAPLMLSAEDSQNDLPILTEGAGHLPKAA